LRVRVLYTGLLRRYIGEKEEPLELPEGATVDDLIKAVAVTYRDRFPASFLAEGRHGFTEMVRASRRGGTFCERVDKLEDGDDIILLSRLAGG
jgi:molybdopterin converting factor small subunit